MSHTNAGFVPTSWSDVRRAAEARPGEPSEALDRLVGLYWPALYAFARRGGWSPEDAADLVQGFVAHLCERGTVCRARPELGRFRTFLLGAFKRHIADHARHQGAARRSPPGPLVSLTPGDLADAELQVADTAAGPGAAFDLAWARIVLREAIASVREEYEGSGRGEVFAALAPPLLEGRPHAHLPPSAADLAARLGMSPGAVHVAAHRLRCRIGEAVRSQIAAAAGGPDAVDDELAHLMAAVGVAPRPAPSAPPPVPAPVSSPAPPNPGPSAPTAWVPPGV